MAEGVEYPTDDHITADAPVEAEEAAETAPEEAAEAAPAEGGTTTPTETTEPPAAPEGTVPA